MTGLLTAIALFIIAESFFCIIFFRKTGQCFYKRIHSGTPVSPTSIFYTFIVLHPYFGFAMRSGRTAREFLSKERITRMTAPNGASSWLDVKVNACSMWSPYDYPYKAAKKDFVVGLFGGSVANWFTLQASDYLKQKLATLVSGQNPVILNFAIPGGKQPQQLAVLNYFLSIGQKLHLAITIDGYNEVVFSDYNSKNGIDFTFPSCHMINPLKEMTGTAGLKRDGLLFIGRYIENGRKLERLEQVKQANPMAFLDMILTIINRFYSKKNDRLMRQLRDLEPNENFDVLPLKKKEGVFKQDAVARHWRESSLLFSRICSMNGIEYLHVLQPYPAVGHKTLTPDEREVIEPDNFDLIKQSYPILLQELQALQDVGVNSVSAVNIFDHIRKTIYSDSVHLNQYGNEVLAEFITHQLKRKLHCKINQYPQEK